MARKKEEQFQEIWVEVGEQSLCALINGERGWLMFLPEEGEPGFSSRNPAYDGPTEATIDYVLENGQRDSYPASWAYPVEEVKRALDYFRTKKERPPFINWFAE